MLGGVVDARKYSGDCVVRRDVPVVDPIHGDRSPVACDIAILTRVKAALATAVRNLRATTTQRRVAEAAT